MEQVHLKLNLPAPPPAPASLLPSARQPAAVNAASPRPPPLPPSIPLPPTPQTRQIWVYGSSLESALVAVVVPRGAFMKEHPDLSSADAKAAMLAVSRAAERTRAPRRAEHPLRLCTRPAPCLPGLPARAAAHPCALPPVLPPHPPLAGAVGDVQGQEAQGLRGHPGRAPLRRAVHVRAPALWLPLVVFPSSSANRTPLMCLPLACLSSGTAPAGPTTTS